MLVAGPVVGNRDAGKSQARRPKVPCDPNPHAAVRGLRSGSAQSNLLCLFRHCYSPLSLIGHFLLLQVKRLGRSLVPGSPGPCDRSKSWRKIGNRSAEVLQDRRGLACSRPELTSIISALSSISANSAGSAPVIHTWLPSCASSRMQARRAAPDRDGRRLRRAAGSARCRSCPQSIGRERAPVRSAAPFARRSKRRPRGCLYPHRRP